MNAMNATEVKLLDMTELNAITRQLSGWCPAWISRRGMNILRELMNAEQEYRFCDANREAGCVNKVRAWRKDLDLVLKMAQEHSIPDEGR